MSELPELPKLPWNKEEGPVFQAPWEASAFAMTVRLFEEGHFTWPEWTDQLSTEIGGRVVAIPLREGELASQGDLLLQLDDSSQQARVELSRRELETIEAQREQACLAAAQAADGQDAHERRG